jgi:hypothetical protein
VFRFRAFCVVVVVPLQPQFRQFAANHSSFSYYFLAKIRQDLTSIVSPFALFHAFCVVVEFHSSHSFAISQ